MTSVLRTLGAAVVLSLWAACALPVGPEQELEQGGAALDDGPQCRDEVVDVNGCGDTDTCRYLRSALIQEDRGCCAPFLRQHVDKLFYDCNGDGRADCEVDQWYSFEDDSCGKATQTVEESSSE